VTIAAHAAVDVEIFDAAPGYDLVAETHELRLHGCRMIDVNGCREGNRPVRDSGHLEHLHE
jgi:hypothetical protein